MKVLFLHLLVCFYGSQAQLPGELRLIDLTSTNVQGAGRLEIFLLGEWGTVCNDGFGEAEANTACHQLYPFAGSVVGNVFQLDEHLSANSSATIWLDDVNCTGVMQGLALLSCSHSGVGLNDCDHSQDVGLVCSVSITCPNQSHGDLRLVNSRSNESCSQGAGRLEIFLNGEWGTVCDDGFGGHEANVTCRQLGFPYATSYSSLGKVLALEAYLIPYSLTPSSISEASSSTRHLLDQVSCNDFEDKLLDCHHLDATMSDCQTHEEDTAVVCKGHSPEIVVTPFTRPIRSFSYSVGAQNSFCIEESTLEANITVDLFCIPRLDILPTPQLPQWTMTLIEKFSQAIVAIFDPATGPDLYPVIALLDGATHLQIHPLLYENVQDQHGYFSLELYDVIVQCRVTNAVNFVDKSITVRACGPTECQHGITNNCSTDCRRNGSEYTCLCNDGFALASDGVSCEDMNECSEGLGMCAEKEDCHNTAGSYHCACQRGYERIETGECEDIDECSLGTHNCPENSTFCVNTTGSFYCECLPGFNSTSQSSSSTFSVCADINECLTGDYNCTELENCINIPGSFRCDCRSGYDRNQTSSACIDVDECLLLQDDCRGFCENTKGSFVCSCPAGFQLASDMATCTVSPTVSISTVTGVIGSVSALIVVVLVLIVLISLVLVLIITCWVRRRKGQTTASTANDEDYGYATIEDMHFQSMTLQTNQVLTSQVTRTEFLASASYESLNGASSMCEGNRKIENSDRHQYQTVDEEDGDHEMNAPGKSGEDDAEVELTQCCVSTNDNGTAIQQLLDGELISTVENEAYNKLKGADKIFDQSFMKVRDCPCDILPSAFVNVISEPIKMEKNLAYDSTTQEMVALYANTVVTGKTGSTKVLPPYENVATAENTVGKTSFIASSESREESSENSSGTVVMPVQPNDGEKCVAGYISQ